MCIRRSLLTAILLTSCSVSPAPTPPQAKPDTAAASPAPSSDRSEPISAPSTSASATAMPGSLAPTERTKSTNSLHEYELDEQKLAKRYAELIMQPILSKHFDLTDGARQSIQRIAGRGAARSKDGSATQLQEAEKNSLDLGRKIAAESQLDAQTGRRFVDSGSVDRARSLLCPPPFYPFC